MKEQSSSSVGPLPPKRKVLILSVGDRRHIGMISNYTTILRDLDIRHDLVCMQRYSHSDNQNLGSFSFIHEFPCSLPLKAHKLTKLLMFLRFRQFAKDIISRECYDFIIVWNENTSALFGDFLLRHFRKRYCLNIRDFGIATSWVLKRYQKLILRSSAFSTFCTPSGIEHLPNYEYTVMLNKDKSLKERCRPRLSLMKNSSPIVVTFMGVVFNRENTLKFIDAFANDERFVLRYFGPGLDALTNYVRSQGIANVEVGGPFEIDRTSQYLDETDIINSYYGAMDLSLKHAVGVKQSYAPLLKIPILVDSETYWAGVAEKFGFGLAVDVSPSLADHVYNWYENLQGDQFVRGCDDYMNYLEQTNGPFYSKCREHIAGIV